MMASSSSLAALLFISIKDTKSSLFLLVYEDFCVWLDATPQASNLLSSPHFSKFTDSSGVDSLLDARVADSLRLRMSFTENEVMARYFSLVYTVSNGFHYQAYNGHAQRATTPLLTSGCVEPLNSWTRCLTLNKGWINSAKSTAIDRIRWWRDWQHY